MKTLNLTYDDKEFRMIEKLKERMQMKWEDAIKTWALAWSNEI